MRKNKFVSKEEFQILEQIHNKTGLSDFWLIGSTTYRKTAVEMGYKFRQNDYDVVVIGDCKKINEVVEILKVKNFTIIKNRPYYLKFKKTFQIMVEKGNLLLDIAVVKNISYLGHFNWESLFWHFPTGRIHDKYNAQGALKIRKLVPIVSVNGENPLILASRFVKICARFGVNFVDNRRLLRFARRLSTKVSKWDSSSPFHGRYAEGYGYFYTLKAIINSTQRLQFISDLKKTGLFQAMFPEVIEEFLHKTNIAKKIEEVRSVKNLVLIFEHSLKDSPANLRALKKRFKVILNRL